MGVVREERLRIHLKGSRTCQSRQAGDEVGAVAIIAEKRLPLEPPHHHVVEEFRGIEPGLAW